jgi:hypothetical protein
LSLLIDERHSHAAVPTAQDLRDLLKAHLCDAQSLRQPEGLATGLSELDGFLIWKGLPKGALSLLRGNIGAGATSLWMGAAAQTIRNRRFAAWVNSEIPLCPLSLSHQRLDLSRFISIDQPESEKKLFWLLQELMSTELFELIGCDLGDRSLREHQVRKLQAQARLANVALVFIAQEHGASKNSWSLAGKRVRGSLASLFSLIIKFQKSHLLIERALHRPTPQALASTQGQHQGQHQGQQRSLSYARFTFHTGDRFIFGTPRSAPLHVSARHEPNPLPEIAGQPRLRGEQTPSPLGYRR